MVKVLAIIFFLLALPIILILVFASLALFGKAKQCSEPSQVSSNALQNKAQELDKKGKTSITSAELTSGLRANFGENVKDFRICFENGKINASGTLQVGNFSPTFYLSTEVIGEPKLHAQNTDVYLGTLGAIPGMSKLFGGIAEGAVNDKIGQIPSQESYSIKVQGGNLEISVNNPTPKKK